MFTDFVARYGEAMGVAAAAASLGLAIDVLVRGTLAVHARNHRWWASEATFRSLRGIPTLYALLIGVRIGIGRLGWPGVTVNGVATGLKVVAALGATWAVTGLAGRLVRIYTGREGSTLPSSTIFVNLARGFALAIGIMIALAVAGVSIAPLVAAVGIGGLAIGLALQPTLENLFSGIQVLMSRQIQPGDFVRLETGQEGWIHDVTWRNTTVKTVSNDLVIVPNSTIAKSLITNFTSMDEQHSVVVPLAIAYASDLDHVERVAREVADEVARATESGVPDFESVVRFREFADSGILLQVVVRATSYADRLPVQHELIKRLHARFAEEGIEIPLPQRVVHVVPGAEEGAADA